VDGNSTAALSSVITIFKREHREDLMMNVILPCCAQSTKNDKKRRKRRAHFHPVNSLEFFVFSLVF